MFLFLKYCCKFSTTYSFSFVSTFSPFCLFLLKSRKNFLINFGGLKHTIFITSPLVRSICKRIQICECVKVTVILAYLRKLRRFCKWDTFRQERGRVRLRRRMPPRLFQVYPRCSCRLPPFRLPSFPWS